MKQMTNEKLNKNNPVVGRERERENEYIYIYIYMLFFYHYTLYNKIYTILIINVL